MHQLQLLLVMYVAAWCCCMWLLMLSNNADRTIAHSASSTYDHSQLSSARFGGHRHAGAVSGTTWQKVLMTEAVAHGAVCLDGSAGGYYLRRGGGRAPTQRFVIFMQGGGWCTSPLNCLNRTIVSGGQLGSSHSWGDT
jgi:hypothetical protein